MQATTTYVLTYDVLAVWTHKLIGVLIVVMNLVTPYPPGDAFLVEDMTTRERNDIINITCNFEVKFIQTQRTRLIINITLLIGSEFMSPVVFWWRDFELTKGYVTFHPKNFLSRKSVIVEGKFGQSNTNFHPFDIKHGKQLVVSIM